MADNRKDNQGNRGNQKGGTPDQGNLGDKAGQQNQPGKGGSKGGAQGSQRENVTGVREDQKTDEKFGQFPGKDADREDISDEDTAL